MPTVRQHRLFLELMLWNAGFGAFSGLLSVKWYAHNHQELAAYCAMVLLQPFFIIYFLREHRALKSTIAPAVSPKDKASR